MNDEWVDVARDDPAASGTYEVEVLLVGSGGVHRLRSEARWNAAARAWLDTGGRPETELWMVIRWKRGATLGGKSPAQGAR